MPGGVAITCDVVARLEHLDVVAGFRQLARYDSARKARANDRDS